VAQEAMTKGTGKTNPPSQFSEKELLGLYRYDAMVRAIAECQEVDETKDIHDRARALEQFSAPQAQSFESELGAMDIRIRAATRAGEILAEMVIVAPVIGTPPRFHR
jgi:hypothetical protein